MRIARRSLAILSTPGRPLGKEERAFNRALARLQALSRALDEEKRRLDRLLVFHAMEVRPRTDRAVALRADLVRALTPFLDDRRLTKAQRRPQRVFRATRCAEGYRQARTYSGSISWGDGLAGSIPRTG